jgi:4-amino-4-deoxy-L-arabinose transferase-like glycosyltransferase
MATYTELSTIQVAQALRMKAPWNSALTADKADIIVEPPREAKHRRYTVALLVALCALTFVFGIGRVALLGPDEPRYAEVAREMLATGDYISTRLCGCLWFEKPALLYWMSAAAYHLFGVTEFAARLPSALSAIVAVLFLYATLRKRVSQAVAAAASLVLATSGIFIGYARIVVPDMALASSMTVALLAGYSLTRAEGRARFGYYVLCSAATALAVLAKGLVAIVLVAPVIALFFGATGHLKLVRRREALAGLVIFIALVSAWYVPVTVKHGWTFIDQFFIQHHFKRYTTNQYHHPQPFYFFPVIAFLGAAPWSFFLMPAVRRLRSLRPRRSEMDSILLLAWIWAAVPVLFFSFSGSKLPGYILPAFPALAIILGVEVEQFWHGELTRLHKAAAWLTALLLVVIAAGFVVYLRSEGVGAAGWRVTLFALPLAVAALSLISLAARRRGAFITSAAAVVTSVVMCSVFLLSARLTEAETLKPLSVEAASLLRPGERITFFLKKEFAPVFYAEGRVVCGVGDSDILNALREDILAEALAGEESLIVITTSNWRKGLETDSRFTWEMLATQGDALAYRVSLKR